MVSLLCFTFGTFHVVKPCFGTLNFIYSTTGVDSTSDAVVRNNARYTCPSCHDLSRQGYNRLTTSNSYLWILIWSVILRFAGVELHVVRPTYLAFICAHLVLSFLAKTLSSCMHSSYVLTRNTLQNWETPEFPRLAKVWIKNIVDSMYTKPC